MSYPRTPTEKGHGQATYVARCLPLKLYFSHFTGRNCYLDRDETGVPAPAASHLVQQGFRVHDHGWDPRLSPDSEEALASRIQQRGYAHSELTIVGYVAGLLYIIKYL